MEIKKLFKRKGTLLAFIAMMLSVQSMFGQDALTSLKFTVKNIALSTNQKEISYDVYVKDIDAANVAVSPAFTVRLMVPQADLGTNAKTVTVTNGTPELGASYATMTTSGTNWLMKFTQNSIALTWASALTISDTGDGTRLGTFHITNTDGTSFTNPVPFNLTFSGTTISTKSSISLFLLNSTTLAPNSTTAQPATNFIGFGPYSLVAATTPLTISSPTITLSKSYDGTTTAAVTAGTLSGVAPADAANVAVSATATYDNATVGTGKTITVHYTLSGSAAGSYSAPADYTVTTGVITAPVATQLTISSPTITLSKAYDTTTSAVVVPGALSGVAPADAANVSVSATAVYNNSTVGTGKTITVTYTLSGSAASSYLAPVSSSVTTGVITALALTVTAPTITLSKVYNGTTSAAVTAGTLSGVLPADAANVTLNSTATYDNATVGTGKTITATYSLSGSAVANYTAPASSSVTTGVITTKALTVAAPTITLSKAYDGTTSAAVTAGTLSGVLPADAANVAVSATATYDNATVGTGKTITVHYTLSGSAAGSYSAPADYVVTTGIVAVKALTIAAPTITLSKVYDGTTTAAVTAGALSGVLPSESANVTVSAAAAYASAAVGTGKTITVTYTLSGSAAGSYIAPVSSSVTTGVITALPLTVSAPTITLSKAYDATTSAAVTAGTLSGVLPADAANVTLNATATYDNATVGTGKTITVTYSLSGSAAANYTAPASSSVMTGVITDSPLDALTSIKFTVKNIALSTNQKEISYDVYVKDIDAANVAVSPAFTVRLMVPQADLGTNAKTVTVTNGTPELGASYATMTTSGTNWLMKFTQNSIALTWASALTISDTGDGTRLGTFHITNTDGTSFTNPVPFNLTFSGTTISTKSSISLFLLNSTTLAPNSTTAQPATNFIGFGAYSLSVAATQLTASAPTITLSKAYDGTTSAAVTAGTLSGVLPADAANVTLNATATYDNATVGTGKTITVHYTLSGSAAGSYTAPADYTVTTGVITAPVATQLTISSPTITLSKAYDATTTAVVTAGTLSGVAPADAANVSVSATATYANVTVGTGKTITVSYTLSGSAASSYLAPVSSSVATGVITAKALTVAAPTITLSKVYNVTTSAAVTAGTLSGVLLADAANVTLNPTATYADATVGIGKTITVTYSLSGSAVANYTAPVSSSVTTGVITALPLTVTAPTITLSKAYDGTTKADVTKGTLSGVLAADVANVELNAVATYDNATEGTGKTIIVTYTLSGSAADNYIAPASTSVATGVITAPVAIPLTVSAPTITLSKVYDGFASADVTKGTLSGVLAADVANVSLVPTGAYDDATVGTGKTITVTYSLTGSAASKYIAPASSSVTTGEITKKSLTASAPTITLSKVYDGTTSAAVTKGTLSGVLAADVANVTLVPTGAYDNATVGTGKTITVTYTLSGSAKDNYTAPASTSVTTGEIVDVPKIQLTVADPTNTFSKEYDGTNTAVVVAGALSGVAAADVNNVLLNPIGTYDDASAGTGKAVTVKYTLSGSAANKYTIAPIKTYSNGEIKRKQLNVSNVKVVTNKGVDGNTMAVVSYNGDLQDVLPVDANKVSVKAVANYDNASVGVNKTITVVYTLSGTSKDNYIAPKETVITNGEIADVIVLNALETSQTMSCEGSDLVLMYRVISGTPTKWRFSYDGAAQVAGVNTSAYNNLSTPDADGTISIVIPTTGMLPGNYKGSLQVQSESGIESPAYTFQFTVNVSSDNVVKMYDDVVTCDNKSNRFVAYQWYKNGFAINGATKQFYCEKDGLNGTYSVQVTTTDGQVLTTCSKSFTTTTVKTVNAYPNPIKSNQSLTVQADGFDNLELENSTLSVYDTFGTLVYQSSKVEKLNMLNLPLAPKVYVGHIKLKNGSDYVFKVIVE